MTTLIGVGVIMLVSFLTGVMVGRWTHRPRPVYDATSTKHFADFEDTLMRQHQTMEDEHE